MIGATGATPELETQRAMLDVEVGVIGSGGARYAAAMYFYNVSMMSCEMLEIYRRCSKFDVEDPIAVAIFENVKLPTFLEQRATALPK